MSKDIEKKLKIVGLIPFWSDKKGGVDLQKIAGKYLIEYTVELLNSSSFVQETIIYSSNKKIIRVDFIQQFKSNTTSDIGKKSLVWEKGPDGWKIIKESWSPR